MKDRKPAGGGKQEALSRQASKGVKALHDNHKETRCEPKRDSKRKEK
jgi:hypothetical protein